VLGAAKVVVVVLARDLQCGPAAVRQQGDGSHTGPQLQLLPISADYTKDEGGHSLRED
jgi:hypothetical protein